jgi:hypothetical protein
LKASRSRRFGRQVAAGIMAGAGVSLPTRPVSTIARYDMQPPQPGYTSTRAIFTLNRPLTVGSFDRTLRDAITWRTENYEHL